MKKIVPFSVDYDKVRTLEKWELYCLIISAIAIFLLWFFPDVELIEAIGYVGMTGYLISSLLAKIVFKDAEKKKREDLLDNSFDTSYADSNTKLYYNNDEIAHGIPKLALNTYESSFHTENTLRHMIRKKALILLILSIPFILSIFLEGGQEVVKLLFKISIPLILITNLAFTIIYYFDVKHLNSDFKKELIKVNREETELNDYSRLLIPVVEYYAIKAWANINLDKDIFDKYNDEISNNWTERKRRLGF